MNEPFTIHVTSDGTVTFPAGCKDIWDAQRAVENRLNERYEERNREEHEHQLKPIPTKQEEYHFKEVERRKKQLENLCLVKAYETLPDWKTRIDFLSGAGYEYEGKYKSVMEKLSRRVVALKDTGEYEKLLGILNR